MNEIHLIRGNNNINVAFHCSSNSLIYINDNLFNVFECLERNGLAYTASKYGIAEEEILDIKCNILKNVKPLPCKKDSVDNEIIDRITLHIANDCNLRCKYCYAGGGNYGNKRELMKQETAQQFVDFCCDNNLYIRNIVFFGGEPLLNERIIQYICDKFIENFKIGKCKSIPRFGIITNGTRFDKRTIQLLEKYISFITVSIDGPKKIHDTNRVYINGNGSYSDVVQFINAIKDRKNIQLRYEATYTKQHLDAGLSISDVRLFIEKEFGILGTVIPDTNLLLSETILNKKELVLSDIDIERLPTGFWEILNTVLFKTRKDMCRISKRTFAVSTSGDIYPCHINTGINNLKIGTIDGMNIINTPSHYSKVFPLYSIIDKKEILCKDCWAQNICGGCTLKWFYDEENKKYNISPKKELCEKNKAYIEKILLIVTSIRKDDNLWKRLVEKTHSHSSSC